MTMQRRPIVWGGRGRGPRGGGGGSGLWTPGGGGPIPPYQPCGVGTTPDTTWYPLGGVGGTPNPSGGNVFYLRPGTAAPPAPDPGFVGAWHFPTFGAGGIGTIDYAGGEVENVLRVLVIGPTGTIRVQTEIAPGGDDYLHWALHSWDGSHDVVISSGSDASGSLFVATFATDLLCTHWLDVTDTGPGVTPAGFGWSVADWTLIL